MARIRVYQGPGDLHPTVTVAETGERIKGVMNVNYEAEGGGFGTITMELAAGLDVGHEIDLTIDAEVKAEGQAEEEDA